MCGICGKINFSWEPVSEELIRRMAATLIHRGPDDAGIYTEGNAGLGHRRLSIIDLSPMGRQPMCNEYRSMWIVFNGEIYNFLSVREELIKKGHLFHSNSDTEVILHLYEEEGPDCVNKLRGMFAFAIWNERDKTLFLARDRIGKKPLFYYHDDDRLIFASEIKAILQDETVARRPDFIAIHHYLTYQYVPSPFSAFEGIKKLPPAHYLIARDGQIEIKRYWKLSYVPKHAMSRNDLKAEIIERLKEAVKIRMISEVPLGAFLSGGIDSSAVVALMSGLTNSPVKTFSIGFREQPFNELGYAQMISRKYDTDHTEFIVEPNAVDILPKLVWHYNEPFADSSAIPTYYVSKLAREFVTVALNGDGGDENFAGYGRYPANYVAGLIRRILPVPVANAFSRIVNVLPHGSRPDGIIWAAKRFLQEYNREPELRNAHWLCHFPTGMKKQLYTRDFSKKMQGTDSFDLLLHQFRDSDAETFLDRSLYADTMMYLPDDLLVKVDVASMANSLEARSPFLDHQFMEFVARIPAELKLKRTTTKFILKESLKGILPDKVLFRKKMGFGVPIDRWFRNELKEMAYDTLLGKRCVGRGYFKKTFIKRILKEHSSGAWNWQHHIWNLLMLELWHREFIDEG